MTSDYVLQIKLDDSQLNRQLERLKQAMGGGTGTGGGTSQTKSPFEKIMKFGVIALGVGELVKMVRSISSLIVDSSPMLKQMLNLFNNELMLMLMPIGNFIGFILQPILLVMLQYVVLPFYRYFMPLAQKYGLTIGDGLARLILPMLQFFGDPVGSLEGLATAISGGLNVALTTLFNVSGIGALFSALTNPAYAQDLTNFGKFLSSMETQANAWLTNQFANITGALGALATQANIWLTGAWSQLTTIFTNMYSIAGKWLTSAWQTIGNFFTTIATDVTYILNTSWKVLGDFFTILSNDVAGTALNAWTAVTDFLTWMGTAIGTAWNAFANAVKTLTGGLISPPTWNGSNSGAATTTSVSSGSATQPSSGVAGHTVNVTVNAGTVISNQDLQNTIKQTVQQVMVKYKYGKP